MIGMDIKLDGDGCWPELNPDECLDLTDVEWKVALLQNGTVRGKPTVLLRVDVEGGRPILLQTTLALFLAAAEAFKGRMEFLAGESRG